MSSPHPPEDSNADDLDDVVQAVLRSRRYRHLAPGLVRRIASGERPKAKNIGDAQKRTQRRLHQVFGAYTRPLPYQKLLATLPAPQTDAFNAACRDILALHASTAERLPDLPRFYSAIFQLTGAPSIILDLACGLNPLCIPWMALPPSTRYIATDIDREMVEFLNRFFALAAVDGQAHVSDLVSQSPPIAGRRADVAFLLKALPCLAHQVDDLLPILQAIPAHRLVVSFPTASLGGRRGKGMPDHYRSIISDLAARGAWNARELCFASELVFVLQKPADPAPSPS